MFVPMDSQKYAIVESGKFVFGKAEFEFNAVFTAVPATFVENVNKTVFGDTKRINRRAIKLERKWDCACYRPVIG